MSSNSLGLNFGKYIGIMSDEMPYFSRRPIPGSSNDPILVNNPREKYLGSPGVGVIPSIPEARGCGKFTVLIEGPIDSRFFYGGDQRPLPNNGLAVILEFQAEGINSSGNRDELIVKIGKSWIIDRNAAYFDRREEFSSDMWSGSPDGQLPDRFTRGKFVTVAIGFGFDTPQRIPINGGPMLLHQKPPVTYPVKGRTVEACLEITASTDQNGCLFVLVRQVLCEPTPKLDKI